MDWLTSLTANRLLLIPALAWATAQVMKFLGHLVRTREVDLSRLLMAGGMPSGHSALVTALAVGMARTQGVESPQFALAAFFAAIVMHDATAVRRSVGIHAGILNRMLDERNGGNPAEKRLREFVGHSPVQVAAGALLGLVLTLVFA